MSSSSLVPRPEKGRRKRAWFPLFAHAFNRGEFHRHRGCSIHVRTLVTSKRIPNVTWFVFIVVSEYGVRFYIDCALSYALQRIGTPKLILKPEQRSVIESICNGKDTFVGLPTGFGKLICYQTLPFVFDKMQRCSCCSERTDTKGRQKLRYVRTDLLSWGRTHITRT